VGNKFNFASELGVSNLNSNAMPVGFGLNWHLHFFIMLFQMRSGAKAKFSSIIFPAFIL